MKYQTYSHRHALDLLANNPAYQAEWLSLKSVLDGLSDEKIIDYFQRFSEGKSKSISAAINKALKDDLMLEGWREESPIFQDTNYQGNSWRLDFAKGMVAVEVAFNHGEAVAWNLIKPNLSGELNHVQKAIQTEIGIVITATESLREAGGFDSAVGTYEKFLTYLKPMRQMLTVPMLIIGLEAPESFYLRHRVEGRKKVGVVEQKVATYSVGMLSDKGGNL
ncbi:BglII/BstYI family type II restriction endonuclease [Sideroxyarcus sp. TK5]